MRITKPWNGTSLGYPRISNDVAVIVARSLGNVSRQHWYSSLPDPSGSSREHLVMSLAREAFDIELGQRETGASPAGSSWTDVVVIENFMG
jgi:hypothetical protein